MEKDNSTEIQENVTQESVTQENENLESVENGSGAKQDAILENKQVQIETLEVMLSNNNIETAVNETLKEKAKGTVIPGFRKGSVPSLAILKKMYYNDEILNKVIVHLLSQKVNQHLDENKIKVVDSPRIVKIDIENYKNNNGDVKCVVEYEPMPNVPYINCEDLLLHEYNAEISEEDLDSNLKEIMEKDYRHIKVDDKEYALQEGDIVFIDCEGKVDGKTFKGGTANNFRIEIGKKTVIPDLENGLIGIKIDEERNIDVNFGDEYHEPSLKGKDAVFWVKVLSIEKKDPLDSMEKLKEYFSCKDDAEVKEKIKGFMGNKAKDISKVLMKEEMIKKIDETYNFDIIESFVKREKAIYKQQFKGVDVESEKVDKEIRKRVKMGMLFLEYGSKNTVDANDQDIANKVLAMSNGNIEYAKKLIELIRKDNNTFANIKAEIIEQKVSDLLLNNIKKEETKVSYNELIEMIKKNEVQDDGNE